MTLFDGVQNMPLVNETKSRDNTRYVNIYGEQKSDNIFENLTWVTLYFIQVYFVFYPISPTRRNNRFSLMLIQNRIPYSYDYSFNNIT